METEIGRKIESISSGKERNYGGRVREGSEERGGSLRSQRKGT